MSQYRELLAQRDDLDRQISKARETEIGDAVARVRELIMQFDLRAKDLFPAGRAKGQRTPVAAKYRDPASGVTWSGRGRTPVWLVGKDRSDYLIG